MACNNRRLQFFFFPAMAPGHMIPMVHMAKLFASRGVEATIVTTPVNAALISKSIQGTNVHVLTFKFPCAEVGLPEGCENTDTTPPHLLPNLFMASQKMHAPLDQILRDHRPDCLVADYFVTWVVDFAVKYNVPTILFKGSCFLNLVASECISLYKPFKNVSSDSEPFLIPNLPDVIQMTRLQIPDIEKNEEEEPESDIVKLFKGVGEAEFKSSGAIVHSFYELEPAYVEYYRKELGKKAWHIGPLSLCVRNMEENGRRGKDSALDEHECLEWLDTEEPNSVIYICFGSLSNFSESQLREIAFALEASGHKFIWVVRKLQKDSEEEQEDWLPEGFEERTKWKGIIIKGWAPQLRILEHKATGAFLSHCGWNSTLEAVSAGVPMVTWPVFADHFMNEQLVTQVLKMGVGVGVKRWVASVGDSIVSEAIVKAMNKVMAGEDAENMRERAKNFSEKAKRAVEEGGSSMTDLDALIQEIASRGN